MEPRVPEIYGQSRAQEPRNEGTVGSFWRTHGWDEFARLQGINLMADTAERQARVEDAIRTALRKVMIKMPARSEVVSSPEYRTDLIHKFLADNTWLGLSISICPGTSRFHEIVTQEIQDQSGFCPDILATYISADLKRKAAMRKLALIEEARDRARGLLNFLADEAMTKSIGLSDIEISRISDCLSRILIDRSPRSGLEPEQMIDIG